MPHPHGFSRSADGGRGPQLQRLACPARRSQPQASHSQNRLQTRAPQRGQGGKGGTKPLTFHARLARITARSVNSPQPALSFGASPPLAAGHVGSTQPSQGSTRMCLNKSGSLVSGAAKRPRPKKTCLLRSTTRTGSQPKKTQTPCLDSSKKMLTPIFVQEFHHNIAQAKKRSPKGVAVGRLSVARPDQRDPRPCLDSSIPNVRLGKVLQTVRGGHRRKRPTESV